MSTRAAIHPMPKKIGRARSHQNSNSIETLRWNGQPRAGAVGRCRHRCDLRGGFLQAPDLAALAHDGRNPGEESDDHAADEHDEEHEDEWRLPRLSRQAEQL